MTDEQRDLVAETIDRANSVLHLDSDEEVGTWLAHKRTEFLQLCQRMVHGDLLHDLHELKSCHAQTNALAIGMGITRAEMFLVYFVAEPEHEIG